MTPLAYSQELADTSDYFDLPTQQILDLFESPQRLLETFSIDFSNDVSTIDLLSFSLGIVMYSVFIWHFYRLISRREIISLDLNRHDSGKKKTVLFIAYVTKYIIVFPLIITAWFFVYSLFMFFLAPDIPQDFVFLVVISLVIAIRMAAYYKEDLSKDLAKMIPFALLGIFLVNTSIFTLDQFYDRLDGFVPFLGKIATFVIFAICVEAVLRVLFSIKCKIRSSSDSKLDEDIEQQINHKINYEINKLVNKQKETNEIFTKQIETVKNDLANALNPKINKNTAKEGEKDSRS